MLLTKYHYSRVMCATNVVNVTVLLVSGLVVSLPLPIQPSLGGNSEFLTTP